MWHSLCFLMVVWMHSWILSDDLLLYAISFVWGCFDHLFGFNCWFQMIIFSKSFTTSSWWSRSNVELWWHFHLNLWVILNSLLGLIEILRFSSQICFGSSVSVVAKSISFIVSMFYIEVPLCTFNWSLWRKYRLAPGHIELLKSELFAIIIHTVSFSCELYGSSLFLKSVPNDEVLKVFSFFVSVLTLLSFGGNSLPCLKALVWRLLLRSGLNIFFLPARNEFTHCFGFWF